MTESNWSKSFVALSVFHRLLPSWFFPVAGVDGMFIMPHQPGLRSQDANPGAEECPRYGWTEGRCKSGSKSNMKSIRVCVGLDGGMRRLVQRVFGAGDLDQGRRQGQCRNGQGFLSGRRGVPPLPPGEQKSRSKRLTAPRGTTAVGGGFV